MDTELQKIASELYGLSLDEFVATRDHLASDKRKEKNKPLADAIKALPKPTLPAWVVNQMVRHQSHQFNVTELLELGEQMRRAQETLQGEELRKLSTQRAALLREMGKQAQALALKLDHPISDDARDEVVATLSAALADPAAAEQVRAGQLAKSIHYSGFGLPAAAETSTQVAHASPEPTQSTAAQEQKALAYPSELDETESATPDDELEPKRLCARSTEHKESPQQHEDASKAVRDREHQTVVHEPKAPKSASRTERAAEAERKMAAAREALRLAEEEAVSIRKEEKEAARLLEHARQEADTAADAEREASQAYERSQHRVQHLEEQLEAAQAELAETESILKEAKETNHHTQEHLYHAEQQAGPE